VRGGHLVERRIAMAVERSRVRQPLILAIAGRENLLAAHGHGESRRILVRLLLGAAELQRPDVAHELPPLDHRDWSRRQSGARDAVAQHVVDRRGRVAMFQAGAIERSGMPPASVAPMAGRAVLREEMRASLIIRLGHEWIVDASLEADPFARAPFHSEPASM